jgi:hypothetical protein
VGSLTLHPSAISPYAYEKLDMDEKPPFDVFWEPPKQTEVSKRCGTVKYTLPSAGDSACGGEAGRGDEYRASVTLTVGGNGNGIEKRKEGKK